jgi:hypothetical protein
LKDKQQQMQVDGNHYKFHKVINIDETDPEFLIFHKLVHMVVAQWADLEQVKAHHTWQLWKKWGYNGLREIQSAQQIKSIMKVENIQEYTR